MTRDKNKIQGFKLLKINQTRALYSTISKKNKRRKIRVANYVDYAKCVCYLQAVHGSYHFGFTV